MRKPDAETPGLADEESGTVDTSRLSRLRGPAQVSCASSQQAETPRSSGEAFPASEPLGNQGLQEPEIELSGKARTLAFEQINEVTWKLTDGRGSNAWNGDRSGGYRTTRAVAWLMGVGNGQWIVRYRNKSSRPMKLPAAKRYALEMVKGIRPGRVFDDPIAELNRMQAIVEEYSAAANKQAAL